MCRRDAGVSSCTQGGSQGYIQSEDLTRAVYVKIHKLFSLTEGELLNWKNHCMDG